MMERIISTKKYSSLINSIGTLLERGKIQVYQSVNTILVKTYWEIGKRIVEYEQAGKERAEYGSALLDNLSRDLIKRFGKGFSRDNLEKMRKFYYLFKNSETVLRKLQRIEIFKYKLYSIFYNEYYYRTKTRDYGNVKTSKG